jgi:X-Pro dipeptidyl-peptidase
MYLFQGTHQSPTGSQWQPLLDAFFAHTLLGVRNGVERGPAVITQGRTASRDLKFRPEASWPPAGTAARTLYLARGADGGVLRTSAGAPQRASYTDMSTAMEETAEGDPASESQWLFYASPPLARATRMVGSARLAASVAIDRDAGQLDPVLVDIAPDGTTKTVSRGFMNLQYRNGLAHAEPVPAGRTLAVTVTFKPQDQTFQAGHRIGVLVMSSNTVWAIPSSPGTGVTVVHGGRTPSRLVLPLVNAPSPLFR